MQRPPSIMYRRRLMQLIMDARLPHKDPSTYVRCIGIRYLLYMLSVIISVFNSAAKCLTPRDLRYCN